MFLFAILCFAIFGFNVSSIVSRNVSNSPGRELVALLVCPDLWCSFSGCQRKLRSLFVCGTSW